MCAFRAGFPNSKREHRFIPSLESRATLGQLPSGSAAFLNRYAPLLEWRILNLVRYCIWWLSLTPFPKANNRRVLFPYSPSMHHLLKNGYKPSLRPFGHDISDKFQKNNGGAVLPNLLAIANTESQSQYLDYCRDKGIKPHPARFPQLLPEYFIRLLTDPGDLVLEPFAGSCVTGMVAERMKRKWVAVEMNSEYLLGALSRFNQPITVNKSS